MITYPFYKSQDGGLPGEASKREHDENELEKRKRQETG